MSNTPARNSFRHPSHSAAQWKQIVDRYRAANQSAVTFAAEHGLSVASLRKWSSRFPKEPSSEMPVHRKRVQGSRPRFVEVALPARRSSAPTDDSKQDGVVELILPNGYVVRAKGDVSTMTLGAMLRVLRETNAC